MNLHWQFVEENEPPEGVILLVYGHFGPDLALRKEGHWYFKNGDDWSCSNIELWHHNTPTHWAEIIFPIEYRDVPGNLHLFDTRGEQTELARENDLAILFAESNYLQKD